MTVYVDDGYLQPFMKLASMKMSHLMADSTDELMEMVDRIGVNRQWLQYPGTWKEHFDISMGKRELAIRYGAVPITMKEFALKCKQRRLSNGPQDNQRRDDPMADRVPD